MTSTPSAPERAPHAPFAHLTAPNAALYSQVMRTFLSAEERFAVHLRPEDVQAALPAEHRPADLDTVVKALDSLVGWGNLRSDPDTARVTAVEDFYRKRFIYQLTQAGEAAEQALSVYDEALGRRGALQAVALHDIVTQLRALLVIASDDEPDAAKAHLALSALAGRFEALAENARAFMGSLQRTIDLHGVEIEVFLAYKDRLIQYLERFIQDLITLGGRIALLIGELEDQDRVRVLLCLAAARGERCGPGGGRERRLSFGSCRRRGPWHAHLPRCRHSAPRSNRVRAGAPPSLRVDSLLRLAAARTRPRSGPPKGAVSLSRPDPNDRP
ncbi:hypothetical protein SSP24_41610 [Streptomyces spinoverrucosus]|uniref:TIGR02677 family protein n=1 Tax=Streptomyces spinoverrucosus TaxID=284043 RepID=A0A4Y3VN97_9ACTN|nr:TIGR02677 family protein [Streptomyces spinoverrucosus]GEC06506.1 hypothetical protein SSP24_41610 [Streptomyces spinoverrucosus]GHB54685.1 hypothetical protein GCM10010397_26240 [Streptomyces spinoverrucosus]